MYDSSILAGRSILVTGGGSGLGLAMAAAFAAHGAKVTIAGRRQERLDLALPEIRAAAREGGEAEGFAADVRDPAQVDELVETLRRALREDRRARQQRGRQFPRLFRGADSQRLRRGRPDRAPRLGPLHARGRTAPPRAQGARRDPLDRDELRLDRHCVRAPLGLRQGGRARHDPLARRRVGPRRDPAQRDRARCHPDRRRVLAPDGWTGGAEDRAVDGSLPAVSERRKRSPTSRSSFCRTSAPGRPETASRWTAASGSPAPANSPTTARSPATSSRPPSTPCARRRNDQSARGVEPPFVILREAKRPKDLLDQAALSLFR